MFPKDPLNILWRYIYFPLFFHVFHLSSSCFSHTWFRGIHSLFIPLLSCLVLTCKTHQYRKDTFFYWMLSVWPCRALGELISPKHCTSRFPSPLPCFSGCPTAIAPLLMLAAKYISPKTGEMKEWVLTIFIIAFFFFLMERMVLPLEFISRCFFGLASVRLWRGVRLEAIREGLGNNTEMLIAMKTADTYLAWSISKWQSWDLNPGSKIPKSTVVNLFRQICLWAHVVIQPYWLLLYLLNLPETYSSKKNFYWSIID